MISTTAEIPLTLYRPDAVRQIEQRGVAQKGISLYQLMIRAGEAIANQIQQSYPQTHHVLVCCGGGNNGGDGYTVARLLSDQGVRVTLWQTGDPMSLSGDAARARDAWRATGGVIDVAGSQVPDSVDLVIDALLGIGVRGAPRPETAAVIQTLNAHAAPILAVDLPSGLCPDTGWRPGVAIHADLTLTLVAIKRGLLTGQARAHVGQLCYADLGIIDEVNSTPPEASLLTHTPSSLGITLSQRSPVVHKGNCGRVTVVGGSVGMGGALCLASEAAARAGAGLVTALTAPEHLIPLMVRCPEVMTQSVAGVQQRLTTPRLEWATALVVGPGLSVESWGKARWMEVLSAQAAHHRPWVVDADALTLLADLERNEGLPSWWLTSTQTQAVLTPHPGEAARLLGCSTQEVERDRYAAVREISRRYASVVALKGAGTLIDDGQRTWVCSLGNPGMASGGMGDVLSGLIGGLLAQGLSPAHACVLGVWLHSRAADLAHLHCDDRALLASDLFATLPNALRELYP